MLLQIGILGDFKPMLRNHKATNDALCHAGEAIHHHVSANWMPTETLTHGALDDLLGPQHAILAAPGSPYRSSEGMLAGIEFARRRGVPFLGTCGGFQYALIEYARNVLGLSGAGTEENDRQPAHAIITPVACAVPEREPGAPRMYGIRRLSLRASTRMARIVSESSTQEEYFCNFEVNPAYVSEFERSGLIFSAFGENGEVRAAELPSDAFYLATLFQPQLRSAVGRPHPILTAFLAAAAVHATAGAAI